MVTAAGSSSGIDIESIVSQLMTLERLPIQTLQRKQSELEIQLSDSAKLKSDMESLSDIAETLADASKFGAWETVSDDEDVLTATNVDGLVAETHTIDVQSLATAHQMITDAFATVNDVFGTGDIVLGSGDETFTVTLDSDNNTLGDLRDAINQATDNTTVQASLINTDAGTRLILTAANTGTANTITVDASGSTRPAAFSEFNAASDASLTIDGLQITNSGNTLDDSISGLTLQLHSIGEAKISSTQNTETIKETLTSFAESYNALRTTMTRLAEGSMQGDSINRRIENSLRQEFFSPVTTSNGQSETIFKFGFTFDREGKLTVDEDTLETEAELNTQSMVNAFTSDETGFAVRIANALAAYTDSGGFFDGRTETIEARQSTLVGQIDRLEDRMESIEYRYRRQFTAMETTVSQLQTSGNYLLSALNTE